MLISRNWPVGTLRVEYDLLRKGCLPLVYKEELPITEELVAAVQAHQNGDGVLKRPTQALAVMKLLVEDSELREQVFVAQKLPGTNKGESIEVRRFVATNADGKEIATEMSMPEPEQKPEPSSTDATR